MGSSSANIRGCIVAKVEVVLCSSGVNKSRDLNLHFVLPGEILPNTEYGITVTMGIWDSSELSLRNTAFVSQVSDNLNTQDVIFSDLDNKNLNFNVLDHKWR